MLIIFQLVVSMSNPPLVSMSNPPSTFNFQLSTFNFCSSTNRRGCDIGLG